MLSPKTVEGHVNNIFRKLDIGDAPTYHRRVVVDLPLRTRTALISQARLASPAQPDVAVRSP